MLTVPGGFAFMALHIKCTQHAGEWRKYYSLAPLDHRRDAKPPTRTRNVSAPGQTIDRICACTELGVFRRHIGKASLWGGQGHFIWRQPMSSSAGAFAMS